MNFFFMVLSILEIEMVYILEYFLFLKKCSLMLKVLVILWVMLILIFFIIVVFLVMCDRGRMLIFLVNCLLFCFESFLLRISVIDGVLMLVEVVMRILWRWGIFSVMFFVLWLVKWNVLSVSWVEGLLIDWFVVILIVLLGLIRDLIYLVVRIFLVVLWEIWLVFFLDFFFLIRLCLFVLR